MWLKVSAATRQAPPGGVSPPTADFVNATTIKLSWQQPGQPNGIIIQYVIYNVALKQKYTVPTMQSKDLTITGKAFSNRIPCSLLMMFSRSNEFINGFVTDLLPYSEHSFILSVCTEAACTNSSSLSIRTLQALPQGGWSVCGFS